MSLDTSLFNAEQVITLSQLSRESEGGIAPLYLDKLTKVQKAVIDFLDTLNPKRLEEIGVNYMRQTLDGRTLVGLSIEQNPLGYPVLREQDVA